MHGTCMRIKCIVSSVSKRRCSLFGFMLPLQQIAHFCACKMTRANWKLTVLLLFNLPFYTECIKVMHRPGFNSSCKLRLARISEILAGPECDNYPKIKTKYGSPKHSIIFQLSRRQSQGSGSHERLNWSCLSDRQRTHLNSSKMWSHQSNNFAFQAVHCKLTAIGSLQDEVDSAYLPLVFYIILKGWPWQGLTALKSEAPFSVHCPPFPAGNSWVVTVSNWSITWPSRTVCIFTR